MASYTLTPSRTALTAPRPLGAHFWEIDVPRVTLPLPALVVTCALGCGSTAEPTPTETPLPPPPGTRTVVGLMGVSLIDAWNVETEDFTLPRVTTSAVSVALLAPSTEEGSSGETSGLGLLTDVALDTCTVLSTSDVEGGGSSSGAGLTMAGEVVLVTLSNGDRLEVPVADEEALPVGIPIQELPPAYLLVQSDPDESLYDPSATYGLTVPDAAGYVGFATEQALTLPNPLALTSPDLSDPPQISAAAGLTVTWEASVSDYVVIDLRSTTGAGVSCVVVDDGSFTLTSGDLSSLPAGALTFSLARGRIAVVEAREGETVAAVGVAAVTSPAELTP